MKTKKAAKVQGREIKKGQGNRKWRDEEQGQQVGPVVLG
jgi:hypothetical protein